MTLSVSLERTDLLNHCGISIEELMADDLSDPSMVTPPPLDGEVDDEVCMSQKHYAILWKIT